MKGGDEELDRVRSGLERVKLEIIACISEPLQPEGRPVRKTDFAFVGEYLFDAALAAGDVDSSVETLASNIVDMNLSEKTADAANVEKQPASAPGAVCGVFPDSHSVITDFLRDEGLGREMVKLEEDIKYIRQQDLWEEVREKGIEKGSASDESNVRVRVSSVSPAGEYSVKKVIPDSGHAQAQCNLGVCYEYGNGVETNKEESFKWYKTAAEQGHVQAQSLAYMPPASPQNEKRGLNPSAAEWKPRI